MHSHKAYKNRKYIENINTQEKDELGFLKMQKQSFIRRKNLPKIPLSFFWISHLLLDMRSPVNMVCILNEPLWEINFSFASNHQLVIASWLKMTENVHFAFQHRDPPSSWVPLSLWVCKYLVLFCWMWKAVSLVYFNSLALTVFLPLFWPKLQGEWF